MMPTTLIAVLLLSFSADVSAQTLDSARTLEIVGAPAVFDGAAVPKDAAAFKASFLAMKPASAGRPALARWSPETAGVNIGTAVGIVGAGVPAALWLSHVDKQASPTHGYLEAAGAQLFVLAGIVVSRAVGRAIGRKVMRRRAELEKYYPSYDY